MFVSKWAFYGNDIRKSSHNASESPWRRAMLTLAKLDVHLDEELIPWDNSSRKMLHTR